MKFITCPRCGGTGNDDGCIGEGLCSLCLGTKVIDGEKYRKLSHDERKELLN